MADSDSPKRGTLTARKTAATTSTTASGTGARTGPRARLAQERARQAPPAPPAPSPAPASKPRPTAKRAPPRPRPPQDTKRDKPRHDAPAQRNPRPRSEPQAQPREIRYFAPCPRGLEAPLQTELRALGAPQARIVAGGVSFTGDRDLGWRANLYSRIASRVLREIAHFPYKDEHEIYDRAHALDWTRYFDVERTIKVEIAARKASVRSLEFTALRIKDAICDAFREKTGIRPDVETSRPDVRVHAFLDDRYATLYLDTSGEALFKRGWRHGAVEAPLRENLAVGMLALSGWKPGMPLVDPFCGGGTLAIEAAQITQGRPPGAWRHFGFEHFTDFDAAAWDAMRHQDAPLEVPLPIHASDVAQAAVDIARGNAKRAGTPIEFSVTDARTISPPGDTPGLMIGNPPYGERAQFNAVDGTLIDADTFWAEFAANLKRAWGGWRVALISSDLDLPKRLRLAPSTKLALYNGALECRLFVFDIVTGANR
ncbi:MAG TPA: THUMP domain-containing protein [Burkholderiaceae bacterium]|nr:THUMP domain-containing protein [Burkholderiaceae bacterium]